jgi:hypothetical protein
MSVGQITFQRRFQIWIYSVSHGQMLLRSTRSDGLDTSVDVLFKDIAALQLPTAFDGLLITEASNDELLKLGPQLGSNSMVNKKVFLI